MSAIKKRIRVVNHMLDKHGLESVEALIRGLAKGGTFAEQARRMNVSRERVRQWALTLGVRTTLYCVDPHVKALGEDP